MDRNRCQDWCLYLLYQDGAWFCWPKARKLKGVRRPLQVNLVILNKNLPSLLWQGQKQVPKILRVCSSWLAKQIFMRRYKRGHFLTFSTFRVDANDATLRRRRCCDVDDILRRRLFSWNDAAALKFTNLWWHTSDPCLNVKEWERTRVCKCVCVSICACVWASVHVCVCVCVGEGESYFLIAMT